MPASVDCFPPSLLRPYALEHAFGPTMQCFTGTEALVEQAEALKAAEEAQPTKKAEKNAKKHAKEKARKKAKKAAAQGGAREEAAGPEDSVEEEKAAAALGALALEEARPVGQGSLPSMAVESRDANACRLC